MSDRIGKLCGWACALGLAAFVPLSASEVRFFKLDSREVFLDGDLAGVSVDSLGVLSLANRVARVGEIEEPFVFSAARHPSGWVLGTGNAGRVLLLSEQGEVTVLLEAEEPTIFAVATDEVGTVWAAGSPGGRIYRITPEKTEIWVETNETYVWDLEPDGDGGIWAATGTEGKVFHIDGAGGAEVVFDADDVHIRSLLFLSSGELLMGTAGEGLVLVMDAAGSVRTLYDSGLSEVVALEPGANGTCYAAVIRSEAGFVEMGAQSANAQNGQGGAAVVLTEEVAGGGAGAAANGVRSQVLRFPCSGGVMETIWSFADETVYDLLWRDDRLWIGTGQEGKVFSLENGNVVLEKDVTERQVISLLPDLHGPALATTNAAAVYRVLSERERTGVYTSQALDAVQISEFGTLHWRGEAPSSSAVRFAFRSGMSGEPDRTWSEWTELDGGTEVSLSAVPPGRFLQVLVELDGEGPSPTVSEVSVSYRQKNLAPHITSLDVLTAGQVLVPTNFNPANQVFEPVTPNREGIFTTLGPERERENGRLKTLWKRGYRTLQWEATDPNEDKLSYRLEFRPEGKDEWFPIVDRYSDTYLSFDSTVVPDGVYRFRLTASDQAGNEEAQALEFERVTGPVTVDHTPPVLGKVTRDGSTVRLEVRDALNALRRAEYSLDGEEWVTATPVDGLLDGRSESFSITVDSEVRLVLFRAMDSFFNLTTFSVGEAGR